MITIQIGQIESINIMIGGRSVRLYQLLSPILLLPIILSNKKYRYNIESLTFLIANSILVLILGLHPNVGSLDMLNHGLTVYLGASIAHLIISERVDISHIALGLFIGSLLLPAYNLYNIEYILVQDSGFLQVPKFVGPGLGSGANGTILMTGIISGVILRYKCDREILRSSILILVFSLTLSLLVSQSRSSILALSVSLGFYIIYAIQEQIQRDIVRPLFTLVPCAGVFFGLSLAAFNPSSVYARLDQIEVGIGVFLDNILFGIGWNNFYPDYYSRHIIHFTPLNYFVFTGIIGGIAYIFTLIYPVLVTTRGIIIQKRYSKLGFLIFGMYIGILIELFLYRKTPSSHHMILGFLLMIVFTPNLPRPSELI
jgi:hypothetical protein